MRDLCSPPYGFARAQSERGRTLRPRDPEFSFAGPEFSFAGSEFSFAGLAVHR